MANNWTIGGRTRHVEVRQYFLRDLKEKNLIVTEHKAGKEMSADIFTKNVSVKEFHKHKDVYIS